MVMYRRFIADKAMDARSSACSAAEIRDLFLEKLVLDYDRVIVISACAAHCATFEHATEASYGLLQAYRERRESAGRTGSFALRVLDSASLCAGQAVLACEAVRLAGEGSLPFEKLRRALKDDTRHTRCLLVPNDLFYLRKRGLDGSGRGLGRAGYALGRLADLKPVLEIAGKRTRIRDRARGFEGAANRALERARDAIRAGLKAPVVALSFGGDPRVVRDMPAYQDLEAHAAAQRVDLHLSVMSATMGVRLGPGALSVAWMEEPA
jgi:fatty acid-binding protein DegV